MIKTSTMQAINNAIKNDQVIEIVYRDKKGVPTVRRVEPYEVKDGKLFAICLLRNGLRAFTLDGITSAQNKRVKFNRKTF